MSVASREQAVRNALARTSNTPGTCQLVTRGYYGAPSAGDRDRDGDADAVDGWASEPLGARHTDRNPPIGVPVAWSGGRHGYGHRAITVPHNGGVGIRSTDAPRTGVTSTVSLSWVETNWGLNWLGWSETITGEPIPFTEGGKPIKPPRLTKVTQAQRLTERAMIRSAAKGQTKRANFYRRALALLRKGAKAGKA